MKKKVLLCMVLLCACVLAGCSQHPPEAFMQDTPAGVSAISALPEDSAATTFVATLYFRHGDSGMLRQETREMSMLPNESREMALVRALLSGSREAGGSALFPEKTEVLSIQTQGNTVFVTFNEALYGRYGDESGALTGAARAEAVLRRNLAMAALSATLTESGEYHRVQVLARAESNVSGSMRLKNSYFLLDDDMAAEPLTRQEAYLPTPENIARLVLSAWSQRAWSDLRELVSAYEQRPAFEDAAAQYALSPALVAYDVSAGTVSPDGQRAVVCVSMTLRGQDGMEESIENWPLQLVREHGTWAVSHGAVIKMMQLGNE